MSDPVVHPAQGTAVGTYEMAVRTGSLLFVSGHGAFDDGTPPAYTEQHVVANGATDLLVRALGESRGKPARSAIGVASLPLGFVVEIEAVVEIKAQDGSGAD